MSYVGNVPTTAAFPFDQFSGNGSTTAFTLSYAPAGTTSIIVSISGVVQNPNTYSVSGTTLTFTPAPPTGTNNIAVLYLGLPVVATLSPGNTAYFSSSVFTATAGQTVFTPSGTYQTGFINVIRNGAQLAPANYTATNGTTVTLANACTAGDIVVIEVFNLTSIAGALPVTGGTVTGATTFNSTVQVNGANVSGFTGFKNRIINPGMVIDQRNNGASVTPGSGSTYVIDRFRYTTNQASKITWQRSTTTATGFINSLSATVASAFSSASTDFFGVEQLIEGFNVADLGWGTANAQPITLSFFVRSSLTGTYALRFTNEAANRSYVATFTINAANTFEQKTISIVGDTTGTWLTNNGAGVTVWFDLGSGSNYNGTAGSWAAGNFTRTSGSVNWVANAGATFFITGVQLERGSNATSYEFRSYGQELQLCQRYAWALRGNTQIVCNAFMRTTAVALGTIQFPVTMRATASLTVPNVAGYFNISAGGSDFGSPTLVVAASGAQITENNVAVTATFASGSSTTGFGAQIQTNNASSYVLFTAEL